MLFVFFLAKNFVTIRYNNSIKLFHFEMVFGKCQQSSYDYNEERTCSKETGFAIVSRNSKLKCPLFHIEMYYK